jgi:hypothetical protein
VTTHRGLQVPAGGVEVTLQIDTTHRQKPNTGHRGDLLCSQHTACAFDSTDDGLTRALAVTHLTAIDFPNLMLSVLVSMARLPG